MRKLLGRPGFEVLRHEALRHDVTFPLYADAILVSEQTDADRLAWRAAS